MYAMLIHKKGKHYKNLHREKIKTPTYDCSSLLSFLFCTMQKKQY